MFLVTVYAIGFSRGPIESQCGESSHDLNHNGNDMLNCIYYDSRLIFFLIGRRPPPFPRSVCNPDVHTDEHQDRRLQRRLFLLRTILTAQHGSEGNENESR